MAGRYIQYYTVQCSAVRCLAGYSRFNVVGLLGRHLVPWNDVMMLFQNLCVNNEALLMHFILLPPIARDRSVNLPTILLYSILHSGACYCRKVG